MTQCSVISPVLVFKPLKGSAAFVVEFFLISSVVHLHILIECLRIPQVKHFWVLASYPSGVPHQGPGEPVCWRGYSVSPVLRAMLVESTCSGAASWTLCCSCVACHISPDVYHLYAVHIFMRETQSSDDSRLFSFLRHYQDFSYFQNEFCWIKRLVID